MAVVYTIVIDPRAIQDIQDAIDYYNEQRAGLGVQFEIDIDKHILKLEKNPFLGIRYDLVRCLPLKKFPYMVHFTVDDEQNLVSVRAVFHTSRDPKKWNLRT